MYLSNKQKEGSTHNSNKIRSASIIMGNQAYNNKVVSQKLCIQRYIISGKTYDGEEFKWTDIRRQKINNGYKLAIDCLEKCCKKKGLPKSIMEAIKKVYKVLTDPELIIFPLTSDWLGQSAYGENQISINIDQHSTPFGVAKTLIHEAFHIIGGCLNMEEDPPTPLPDEPLCDHRVSKINALKILEGHEICNMSADHFAQFVLKS